METPILSSLGEDGAACVALLGEIDFANADEVAQGIRDAIAEWSPPVVRVDLRDAAFIDSTGLGALIEGYQAATEEQSGFVVVNPTPGLRRVLSVTGLTEVFGLTETAEEGTIDFAPTEATGA